DPTQGVANALLYPTAHAASPLDTANNRRRAEFDSARVRLAPVQPTAADTARCISEVEALAKTHGVDLSAGRGGGRGGLPGGGCAGSGLLLDIRDTPHPTRIAAYAGSNFSFWHSATVSNDGKMVLFSDEWGGGGAAYCRAGDPKNWGADAIFKIVNGKLEFQN